MAQLSPEERAELLTSMEAEDAADLLETLPGVQASHVLEELAPDDAASIVSELHSDDQADLLGRLPTNTAEAILEELPFDEAAETRALTRYEPDVAGGLMVTEYLSYRDDQTVLEIIDDLGENSEEYKEFDIQYAYVVDDAHRLEGVLPMRDLLLANRTIALRHIMIPSPHAVRDEAKLDELIDFFALHHLFGAPVIDDEGKLIGVVHESAVEHAQSERIESDHLKSQGIVGEELRSMPLLLRSRRRLGWLSINIVLNMIAASVIAAYQDTLASVIALAVFLPIISDMSGCSGNQAVAVSMRELTLGILGPRDVLATFWKEISVGLINGLVLGALIGIGGFIWQGNVYLGLVIGLALMANTVIAVSIGGCVPLVLKKFKMDPALASGPVLTTLTDMCGFLLVLSLATAMLSKLT